MVGSLNERYLQPFENTPNIRQVSDFMPLVLIVDEDDDSRQMLRFLLESWHYSVIEARNGSEALGVTAAKNKRLDLILMDVRLPNLDGFETTRQIRRTMNSGNVPIIFISGCAETKYFHTAYSSGGDEYLVKPLDFDKLQNTLGKYIQ